jgi:hypothetical protein
MMNEPPAGERSHQWFHQKWAHFYWNTWSQIRRSIMSHVVRWNAGRHFKTLVKLTWVEVPRQVFGNVIIAHWCESRDHAMGLNKHKCTHFPILPSTLATPWFTLFVCATCTESMSPPAKGYLKMGNNPIQHIMKPCIPWELGHRGNNER